MSTFPFGSLASWNKIKSPKLKVRQRKKPRLELVPIIVPELSAEGASPTGWRCLTAERGRGIHAGVGRGRLSWFRGRQACKPRTVLETASSHPRLRSRIRSSRRARLRIREEGARSFCRLRRRSGTLRPQRLQRSELLRREGLPKYITSHTLYQM